MRPRRAAKKSRFFKLSVEQVSAGSAICRENAGRLLADAAALLESARSRGTTYVLWSLAVEEYGKALILEKLTAGKTAGVTVQVPKKLFRGHHKQKFGAGFDRIKHRMGDRFAEAVAIFQNASDSSTMISHPRDPNWRVLVNAGETGEIEDVSSGGPNGRQASHRLRFELLYVDWDDGEQVWCEPEPNVLPPGSLGRFTVSSGDLERAIAVLKEELA